MRSVLNLSLAVAASVAASFAFAGAAQAATSVGVSIGINQPGVYGRINIGDIPPPAIVYEQPLLIAPPAVRVQRRPIYLYVPPGHQRDWRRYCGRYAACGQPVYFVKEEWVRERYVREHPGWRDGRHDDRRYEDRRHEDRRGDERKRGHGDDRGGHGNGKGNGHRD